MLELSILVAIFMVFVIANIVCNRYLSRDELTEIADATIEELEWQIKETIELESRLSEKRSSPLFYHVVLTDKDDLKTRNLVRTSSKDQRLLLALVGPVDYRGPFFVFPEVNFMEGDSLLLQEIEALGMNDLIGRQPLTSDGSPELKFYFSEIDRLRLVFEWLMDLPEEEKPRFVAITDEVEARLFVPAFATVLLHPEIAPLKKTLWMPREKVDMSFRRTPVFMTGDTVPFLRHLFDLFEEEARIETWSHFLLYAGIKIDNPTTYNQPDIRLEHFEVTSEGCDEIGFVFNNFRDFNGMVTNMIDRLPQCQGMSLSARKHRDYLRVQNEQALLAREREKKSRQEEEERLIQQRRIENERMEAEAREQHRLRQLELAKEKIKANQESSLFLPREFNADRQYVDPSLVKKELLKKVSASSSSSSASKDLKSDSNSPSATLSAEQISLLKERLRVKRQEFQEAQRVLTPSNV